MGEYEVLMVVSVPGVLVGGYAIYRLLKSTVYANNHEQAKQKSIYAAKSQGFNVARILSSINIIKRDDDDANKNR